MYYSTFDLIFKSKDLLLPELQKVDLKNGNYDVLIQKYNHKNWPSIEKGKYDTEFLKMAKNDFRLTIKGIAEFRVLDSSKIYWDKINKKEVNIFRKFPLTIHKISISESLKDKLRQLTINLIPVSLFIDNDNLIRINPIFVIKKISRKIYIDTINLISKNS